MTDSTQERVARAKALDLSYLLEHAFNAGRISALADDPDENKEAWVEYDPDECSAFERVTADLSIVAAMFEAQGVRVGDTPQGSTVRFAVPSGSTRKAMREWLFESREGQSLHASGDCLLVWANEGDLFSTIIEPAPVTPARGTVTVLNVADGQFFFEDKDEVKKFLRALRPRVAWDHKTYVVSTCESALRALAQQDTGGDGDDL